METGGTPYEWPECQCPKRSGQAGGTPVRPGQEGWTGRQAVIFPPAAGAASRSLGTLIAGPTTESAPGNTIRDRNSAHELLRRSDISEEIPSQKELRHGPERRPPPQNPCRRRGHAGPRVPESRKPYSLITVGEQNHDPHRSFRTARRRFEHLGASRRFSRSSLSVISHTGTIRSNVTFFLILTDWGVWRFTPDFVTAWDGAGLRSATPKSSYLSEVESRCSALFDNAGD